MQLFQHKATTVKAFQLPLWGKPAATVPPDWFVQRLQSGLLEMNGLGGVTMTTPVGCISCAAGDVVVLFADDSVGFEKPDEFERDFQPVSGTGELHQVA